MQHRRLIEFIFLIWATFTSFYWLILFPDPMFQAIPFLISLTLMLIYLLAFLKNLTRPKRVILRALSGGTIFFSFWAYKSAPPCHCYETSLIDLLPNAITLVMAIIVWYSLPKPYQT